MACCVPADPASKDRSENAVKIAKAVLVPTEANLLPDYPSFAELEPGRRAPRPPVCAGRRGAAAPRNGPRRDAVTTSAEAPCPLIGYWPPAPVDEEAKAPLDQRRREPCSFR